MDFTLLYTANSLNLVSKLGDFGRAMHYTTIRAGMDSRLLQYCPETEGLQIQALLDGLDLLFGPLHAAFVAASTLEGGVFHLAVELNLGLST